MRLLALAALAAAGCAQVDENLLKWSKVEIADGRISFEIPDGYELAQGSAQAGGSDVSYRNYSRDINGKLLAVLYCAFQEEIDEGKFQFLPPKIDEGASELSRKPLDLSSIRGQETLVKIERENMLVLTRQYAFGKAMVTMVASAPPGEITCPLISKFMESLALRR